MHHIGSASARIVGELAERHPGVVPSDPDELREFFAFRDFAHFIEVYLAVVDLIRTPEDLRYLTYEVAREMAEGQRIRYAELTCTPYTSIAARHPRRGLPEAIEDARVAAERDFGLVLRWIYDIPGESGVPVGRRSPSTSRSTTGSMPSSASAWADRRSACRAAVRAALRRRAGRRPAQRPARRRDHRPRDRLGRAATAGRRADRARHLRRAGPGAARPPRRDRRPPRGLPVLQRRHPRGRLAGGTPPAQVRRGGRDRHHQLRRPADVRHLAQPGVRRRGAVAGPRRGRRRRPGPGGRAPRPSPTLRSRPGSSARSTRPLTMYLPWKIISFHGSEHDALDPAHSTSTPWRPGSRPR